MRGKSTYRGICDERKVNYSEDLCGVSRVNMVTLWQIQNRDKQTRMQMGGLGK